MSAATLPETQPDFLTALASAPEPIQDTSAEPAPSNGFSMAEHEGVDAALARLLETPEVKNDSQAKRTERAMEEMKRPERTNAPDKPQGQTADPVAAERAMEDLTKPVAAETTDADLDAEIATSTKGMGKKQQEAFKMLRYEHRDQQRKLKEMTALQDEIKALKSAPAKPDEAAVSAVQKKLEEVQALADAREKELMSASAEKSDYFKTKFAQPLSAIEMEFDSITKNFNLDPFAIQKAMALPEKERDVALSEIAAELPSKTANKFYGLLDARQELATKRQEFLASASENYTKQQQAERETAAQTKAEQASLWKKTASEKWSEIYKDAPWLEPVEDTPKEQAEHLKFTKEWAVNNTIADLDLPSQVLAMHRAAVHPILLSRLKQVEKENANLKGRIAEFRTATPKAGGNTPGPSATKAGKIDEEEGMSVEDRLTAAINRSKSG